LQSPAFDVTKGSLDKLKEELIIGDQTAIILIPENFTFTEDLSQLSLILDASQVRQASSNPRNIGKFSACNRERYSRNKANV
jgi:hypothetical protein